MKSSYGFVLAATLMLASVGMAGAQTGNLLLTYDEVRFSVTNTSDEAVSLRGLAFVRGDPRGKIARFEASSWLQDAPSLGPGDCTQLVFGLEQGPLRPPGCEHLRSWRATRRAEYLFWLADEDEKAYFRVFHGSRLLAVCEAGAGTCVVDAPNDAPAVLVGNLLLYYTRATLVIFNDAANTAPPLQGLVITSAGGDALALDAVEWQKLMAGWDGETLGAGQCLVLYEGDAPPAEPEMRCEVVAQAGLDAARWHVPFEVTGSVLGRIGKCPAARVDTACLCVVPQ